MSISSAISNAVTGLTATSRGTEIISSNLANALTPGYARREIDLASRVAGHGGGVGIIGVDRIINTALLADNRLAHATVGAADTVASFHAAMEGAFGKAGSSASLGGSLVEFEAALTGAAARPDSESRLSAVLDAASALAGKVNDIAAAIQSERSKAEQTIKNDVARLNHALAQVAELNGQIVSVTAQGKNPASLMDARQAAVDAIAQIVPINEVARENGRVALFTAGGAILLDGTTPARIEFDRTAGVNASMSLPSGQLSTLTFNGKPLTNVQQEMFAGGTLGASFNIRDTLAPSYQSQIDAFARELYDRLADPVVDPSLNAGAPGIFTDSQSALDPANELGFSSRITVHAALDPEKGGALWRLRAGVNATTPGSVGESALLGRIENALAASRSPVSANMAPSKRSLQVLTAEMSSDAASKRIRSTADALQSNTHHSSLKAALLADGVDTDKEMESLLALERAYSANAKVFQTANDMLDAILRLT